MNLLNISADTILKFITILGGAWAWLYQWRNLRFRSNLKTDLEILKSLEPSGKEEREYKILKAHINTIIAKAYSGAHPQKRRKLYWFDLFQGLLFLTGSFAWTVDALAGGLDLKSEWWRLLIALLFAFVGFASILNGLNRKHVHERSNKEGSSTRK
jgi:hypothetical protein